MKIAEIESFSKRYSDRLPEFKFLRDEAKSYLKKAIIKSKLKVHSIIGRIKGFDSCVDKIMNKKTENPFDSIKDFVGLRVVCLFLSDLDRVEKVINETFEVLDRKDKTNGKEKDVFGYMGTHYIVRLKMKKETNPMPFEIQVRTIAQDAWASVSHHLDYKTNSIPEEFKKDFHALSGLFYVADTHFSFIKQDKMQGI